MLKLKPQKTQTRGFCPTNLTMKAFLVSVVLIACIVSVNSHEKQITVNIESRKQDCFFEHIKEKQIAELDYQVIDGGHGDLDITFHVFDPNGRILVADYKKSGNNHRIDSQTTGDFRFCFDNSFSSFNTKTVFFEIVVENDESDWGSDENLDDLNPEEVYELKVQDIQEIINKVRTDLNKIRQLQDVIKSTEARDRNIAEENNFKVTTFSVLQIMIMLTVGAVQVVMLRSLFDDKSRVHKVWKMDFSNH